MASTTTTRFALPLEIVLMILEILHGDYYKNLFASLLVDKTWNQLATQVLYKDLYLDPDSIEYYIRPAQRRSSECTRSITAYVRIDERDYLINRLRPHLSTAHTLLSFSFLGDIETVDGSDSQGVVELAKLLEALPLSVQYLEIRVDYRISSPEYQHGHLCPILSKILPRLRGLRLEAIPICPCWFNNLQERCQHLENITIQSLDNKMQYNCAQMDPVRFRYRDNSATNHFLAGARRSVEAG